MKTIADIRALKPCIDPGKYIPGNWEGTALDILRMGKVPLNHRYFVILRIDWIPIELLIKFALQLCKELLKLDGNPSNSAINIIDSIEWNIYDPLRYPYNDSFKISQERLHNLSCLDLENLKNPWITDSLIRTTLCLSRILKNEYSNYPMYKTGEGLYLDLLKITHYYDEVINKFCSDRLMSYSDHFLLKILWNMECDGATNDKYGCSCITNYDLTFKHKLHNS